ncbi:MAG: glycosyltransferase [Candidatus Cloacimonetes bacterium]|nr:glycosyltransferase [Candidatus Cloacimonadota bacterium]
MKILIFSHLFPNNIDQTSGIFVFERVKFLKQFFEITIVAPVPYFPKIQIFKKWSKFSKIPKYEIIEGIEIFHPRYLLFPKNLLRPQIGLFLFFSTFNLIKSLHSINHFDLIHAHFIQPSGIAASMIGEKIDVPVVITEHFGRLNDDLENRSMQSLIKKTFEKIDKLIVVSERLQNELLKKGYDDSKITVIPNGVDMTKFIPNKKPRQVLNQINLISIGNLIENKGYRFLIKAIKLLVEKNINVKLRIIGEGILREELQKMIEDYDLLDHVTLIGEVKHDLIFDYLDTAHMLIHPSLIESFSVVTIEALACGLPVVVTACGGPENFVNKRVGVVVNKGDSRELASGINYVINNYDKYDPDEICEYCRNNFSYEIIIKKISDLYREVINEH